MGLEVMVPGGETVALSAFLEALAKGSFPTTIIMVDGALVMPRAVPPPPDRWRDVRLKTPGGTVTLARRPNGVAVLVFGNAEGALAEAQRRVVEVLSALATSGTQPPSK